MSSLRLRRPSFETDEGDDGKHDMVHAGKRVATVIFCCLYRRYRFIWVAGIANVRDKQ